MSCLSFAMNHYVHRLDVTGYHVVNILIHVSAAWFLFLFLEVTLRVSRFEDLYRKRATLIALLASLLWALHPLQTQAVTYIVQRMASLAGMFYIMSMYCFARARTLERAPRRGIYLLLSLLTGLFALGSKENAILLPVSMLGYEVFVLRDTSLQTMIRSHWQAAALLLTALACVMLGYMEIMRGGEFTSLLTGYSHRVFSLEERLLTEPRIVAFYISLLLFPIPERLSVCHSVELSTSLVEPFSTLTSIAVIVALLAGAFRFRRRFPLTSFAVLFFFLNHAVESTFLPLELVFEHRNYIPSMLFFLPPALLLAKGRFGRQSRPVRRVAAILAVGLPVALGFATHVRNLDWKPEERLWIDAARKSPHTWRPFHNLGYIHLQKQEYEQALSWFKKALGKRNTTILREKHLTLFNMGVAYQAMGRESMALAAYRHAEEIYSGLAELHVNKGVILMNRGNWDAARNSFRRALTIVRSLPAAHSNLGWLLFKTGNIEDGLRHLHKAVRLAPDNLVTLKRLAYALLRAGRHDEAEGLLNQLRRARPRDLSTLLFLAEIHLSSGRTAQAENALRTVSGLLGKNGLSRLIRGMRSQQEQPSAMLPDKELLLPLLESMDPVPSTGPGPSSPTSPDSPGDQQQGGA